MLHETPPDVAQPTEADEPGRVLMGEVALLEGGQLLSEDRLARSDLGDVGRRREPHGHVAVEVRQGCVRGGVEQNALIGEILPSIDHRTVLSTQRAVMLIHRFVHRAAGQAVDRPVQQLRGGVDIDAAGLDAREAVFNDQVPGPRGGAIKGVQRGHDVLQGHFAAVQGDGDAVCERDAEARRPGRLIDAAGETIGHGGQHFVDIERRVGIFQIAAFDAQVPEVFVHAVVLGHREVVVDAGLLNEVDHVAPTA